VNVGCITFLMIDGDGDPNSSGFQEAVEALFSLSYTLKFAIKKGIGIDYRVAPLEALWWSDSMDSFLAGDRDRWRWTAMIAQPSVVDDAWLVKAMEEVKRKKNPAALARVRFAGFTEGLSAQIMHVGPYSEEAPTIEKLHAFIREQGGTFEGHVQKHHEIYLGDPRRAAPEKLKTVIRQPFERA